MGEGGPFLKKSFAGREREKMAFLIGEKFCSLKESSWRPDESLGEKKSVGKKEGSTGRSEISPRGEKRGFQT